MDAFHLSQLSVKTDMLPGRALSRLYIANANRQDTGNYTCLLGNEITETVVVHVLNGKSEVKTTARVDCMSNLIAKLNLVVKTMMESRHAVKIELHYNLTACQHLTSSSCSCQSRDVVHVKLHVKEGYRKMLT